MNRIIAVLILALLAGGCSRQQDPSKQSAVDMVQPGQDINWADGYMLRVTSRTGDAISGISIIRSRPGVAENITITAEKGTVSPGQDANSVRVSVYNVETLNGKNHLKANKMDFVFTK